MLLNVTLNNGTLIREIPDHATFREKEHSLGWLDNVGLFLSLALSNLTSCIF